MDTQHISHADCPDKSLGRERRVVITLLASRGQFPATKLPLPWQGWVWGMVSEAQAFVYKSSGLGKLILVSQEC